MTTIEFLGAVGLLLNPLTGVEQLRLAIVSQPSPLLVRRRWVDA